MTGPDAASWKKALALQDHGQASLAVRELRALGFRLVRQRQDLAGMVEVARQLCFLYDYDSAVKLMDAVVRLAGKQPALLVRLALLLLREGRYADATRFARQALAVPADSAKVDALLILAECEERLGHLEPASSLVEEALKTDPASIPAHRQRAVLLRRQGRPDEALAALRKLLQRGGPPHWETCRAWFELGHVQDQLGNWADAWTAWTTARNFHAPDTNWKMYEQQAGHVWTHVRALHRSLSADQLRRWAEEGAAAGNQPESGEPHPVVLTGHPRSGTTLLEQALDAHSAVGGLEETTIFTSNVYRPLFQHGPAAATPAQRLDSMGEKERRHWRREYYDLSRPVAAMGPGQSVMVDKNPDLLQLLPAWLRIFPEAKIIVMLRDPRDLLVSMFSQALPPNHTSWSYRSLAATAAMISLRLGMWHHLRQSLPATCFLERRYENLVRNFPSEVGGTLEFLGLKPEPATLQPAVRAREKVVRSPTYSAVQEPVHTRAIARWMHYQPWIDPHLETLRPALRGLGYPE